MLEAIWNRVRTGETLEFRPKGGSMRPHVTSGALVRVVPVDPSLLEVGDIVLVKVAGSTYLHLVSAVDAPRQRVQISNASKRVNGWASWAKVAGICVSVDGVARRGAAAKARR